MSTLAELAEQLTKEVEALKAQQWIISDLVTQIQLGVTKGESTGDPLRDFVTLHCSPADPRFEGILERFSTVVEELRSNMTPGAPLLLVRTTVVPAKTTGSPRHFGYTQIEMFGAVLSGSEMILDPRRKRLDFPHTGDYVAFEYGSTFAIPCEDRVAKLLTQSFEQSVVENAAERYFYNLLASFVRQSAGYSGDEPHVTWRLDVGVASVAQYVFGKVRQIDWNATPDTFLDAAYGPDLATTIKVAHRIAQ